MDVSDEPAVTNLHCARGFRSEFPAKDPSVPFEAHSQTVYQDLKPYSTT